MEPMEWIALAGAVLGAASAQQQGQIASDNSQSQANVSKYNAQVADNNAVALRQQAGANEEAQRRQSALALGTQRANIMQTGSGLDSYGQSLANAELSAQNIRYGGDVAALGASQQSTLQTASSEISSANASTASSAIPLNMASSLASGATNYYNYQSQQKLPVYPG